jgi:hypothetical protein
MLCTECNFVTADEAGACPVCQGHCLLRLSDLLRERNKARDWPSLRDLLEFLGFRRRRPRPRDLGYATRQY